MKVTFDFILPDIDLKRQNLPHCYLYRCLNGIVVGWACNSFFLNGNYVHFTDIYPI